MTPDIPLRESLFRIKDALDDVSSAYRAGDYAAALEKTENLKDGSQVTAPYCCFSWINAPLSWAA